MATEKLVVIDGREIVGTDGDVLLGRVADLATRLPATFDAAASTRDVKALGSPLPRRLADLVAERCTKLFRVLV